MLYVFFSWRIEIDLWCYDMNVCSRQIFHDTHLLQFDQQI